MGHPVDRVTTDMGFWIALFFVFPEAQDGAGGVGEDAEPAHVGDFGGVPDEGGSEGDGLFGGGFDVVDEHVREPQGGGVGHGVFHHAATRAVFWFEGGVDHAAAHVGVGDLPVEEGGVEGFGFDGIGGVEFHVTERVGHDLSFWVGWVFEPGFEEDSTRIR